eukprot:scaffold1509_cov240-Pinguiococcus_pyrenoidosus.AAC.7
MRVFVRRLQQVHQRPQHAHALAGAVVLLDGRHVVEREGRRSLGLQVVALQRHRHERRDGAAVEQLLLVLSVDGQVADAQDGISLGHDVVAVVELALGGEERQSTRHFAPHLHVLGGAELQQRPQDALIQHATLRAALHHLGHVGQRGAGRDECRHHAVPCHADLVLLGERQVAKHRRHLALDFHTFRPGGQDERLQHAFSDQPQAESGVRGQAAQRRHRLELHVHGGVGAGKGVGDERLEAAGLHHARQVVGVGAQVAQCEHGVLAALHIAVLAEAGQRGQRGVQQLLVVLSRDAQVGQHQQAVARGLEVRAALGIQRQSHLLHHGVQHTQHLRLILHVGAEVAKRHGSHSGASVVIRFHQRQKRRQRAQPQDVIADVDAGC